MRHIQPDLWETEVEAPFPGLTTHAYLLVRDEGNVLFYSTGHPHELDNIEALGGLSHQFLSHRDEVGEALNRIAERFGSKLAGHENERTDIGKVREPDILFRARELHLGNIEVIPTPGHSPGSTCFFVTSPHGKRYLFTGDTIFRGKGGGWLPGFIPGHSTPEDRVMLGKTLRFLRTLAPDVVLGSAFGGDAGFEEMAPTAWPSHVDHALRRLDSSAGELF
jgi:hydroxyacylglutathione hydrolase